LVFSFWEYCCNSAYSGRFFVDEAKRSLSHGTGSQLSFPNWLVNAMRDLGRSTASA